MLLYYQTTDDLVNRENDNELPRDFHVSSSEVGGIEGCSLRSGLLSLPTKQHLAAVRVRPTAAALTALSVSTSHTMSPAAISSPTSFAHEPMFPCVIVGDSAAPRRSTGQPTSKSSTPQHAKTRARRQHGRNTNMTCIVVPFSVLYVACIALHPGRQRSGCGRLTQAQPNKKAKMPAGFPGAPAFVQAFHYHAGINSSTYQQFKVYLAAASRRLDYSTTVYSSVLEANAVRV